MCWFLTVAELQLLSVEAEGALHLLSGVSCLRATGKTPDVY